MPYTLLLVLGAYNNTCLSMHFTMPSFETLFVVNSNSLLISLSSHLDDVVDSGACSGMLQHNMPPLLPLCYDLYLDLPCIYILLLLLE